MRAPRFGPGGPFDDREQQDRRTAGAGDSRRFRGPGGHRGWGPPTHGGHGEHGGPRGRGHDEEGHRFRGRTRRGEIRTGLLAILAEGPGHGYEIIQRIEEKTGGAWKPSPGSVYPTLQMLQDEGLVTAEERDGKRVFSLTDEGRAESARRTAEASDDPFTRGRPDVSALFESIKPLFLAAKQVSMAGDPTQIATAVTIITDARKKLYQLLAAD